MKTGARVVVALAALSLAASLVAMADPATAHVHVIDGGDPFFDPFETVIRPGDAVEWDNHADRIHTVTDVRCRRADTRNDDSHCDFDTVFDLTPGTTFRHVFAEAGIYDYKCTIHNFTGRITVVADEGALPDLLVADLSVFDTPVPTNKRMQATVRNDGDAVAIATKLRFAYQNADGTWIDVGEVNVPPLNPGATQVLNQTWLVANKAGDFPVRAIADALATIIEQDEGNNDLTVLAPVWLPAGVLPGIALPEPP